MPDRNPEDLRTREERFSPQINNIDPNAAQVLRNAGYNNLSLPDGVTANPNYDVNGNPLPRQPQHQGGYMNQNISPGGSQQEYIEYNQGVNIANYPPQNQGQFQQQANQDVSHVGRNSPYKLVDQLRSQEQQDHNVQFMNMPEPPQNQNNNQQKQENQEFYVNEQGQFVPIGNEQQQTQNLQQGNQGQTASQVLSQIDGNQNQQQNIQQPQVNPQQNQNVDPEKLQMKAELDAIKAMLANGQGAQQNQERQAVDQQNQDEPPTLDKFTEELGDDWNPEEALDFRTKSGKAYAKFQAARDNYLASSVKNQVAGDLKRQEADRLTLQRAQELSSVYPEFRNMDGSPNIPKIQQFFDTMLNNTNWANLKRAYDLVNNPNQNVNSNPMQNYQNNQNRMPQVNGSMQQMLQQPNNQQNFINPNQVGQMATRIVPINNGGGASNMQPQRRVPESIQQMQKMYGTNFELPPDSIIR